jgi:hypothetical protein
MENNFTYKQHLTIYNTISDCSIIRIEDNACIPFVEANTDYQIYLKWLTEGNTPEPADE